MNSNHQVHSQFSLEIVVPGSAIYLGRFHQLLAQYKTVLLKKLDLGHGRTICWQLLWNMNKFHWCELYFEQENVEIIFAQHCTNWSIISFNFYLISLHFFVFYSTWSQPKLQCKMQIIQMTQSQSGSCSSHLQDNLIDMFILYCMFNVFLLRVCMHARAK